MNVRVSVIGAAVATVIAELSFGGVARADGALETIAIDLAQKLGAQASAGTIHVVAPAVTSDVTGTRGPELGARLAERLSAHLNKDPKGGAGPAPAPNPAGPAGADRSGARVVLQATLTKGLLGVTADLYAAQGNGWDRVRSPSPAAAVHGFSSARIDAEVRSFLPPILLEQATLHRAKAGALVGPDDEVVALGCGAIDDGGPIDLVVVTRVRVKVGRLVKGAFAVSDDVAWSDLAPRTALTLRDPVGGVSFSPRFSVGTSDRGGVYLVRGTSDAFAASGAFPGIPVGGSGGACAHVSPENDGFTGAIDACGPPGAGETAVAPTAPPSPSFDAVAVSSNVQKDGRIAPLVATRSADGGLHLSYAGGTQTWTDTGAQVAAFDMDLDGVPEVATTRAADPDAITVTSWGQTKPRLRFPASAPVRALAACPAEDRGAPALAAIVGDEVWLVR